MKIKNKPEVVKRKPVAKRKTAGKGEKERPSPTSVDAVGQIAGEIHTFRKSILAFVERMWGLTPQEPKPEYKDAWEAVCRSEGHTWLKLKETVRPEWFGDSVLTPQGYKLWTWYNFKKGEHLTWQQSLILLGVEKAQRSKVVKKQLSIRSGHGIGKSALVSWVVLWFLYCFYHAQVPVTAPTSGQMHDVLWKELSLWITRIKIERVQEVFEWQSGYIRMQYDPDVWFARAKTSTKENTEALAGVHSDHVLIAADEASGVPEQVYNTAEGALTSGNVWTILISNPTRTMGYFFDSHHKNDVDWQTFAFSSEESPVVDVGYVDRQARRHGVESDEYRIRVLGRFPSEDMMDDSGYLQLVPRSKVIIEPSYDGVDMFVGRKKLAIDPSGEGDDECEFLLRDNFRAQVVKSINTTNEKEIAEYILTFIDRYNLKTGDIVIEGFGIGSNVNGIVSKATKGRVELYVVLPGNSPKEEMRWNGNYFHRFRSEITDTGEDMYLNLRATGHFRMRDWLLKGGRLMDNDTENSELAEQIASIRYKRTLQGNKLQIMPKQEQRKLRIKSPNKSDALMLSFLLEESDPMDPDPTPEEQEQIMHNQRSVDDPFGVV